SESRRQIELVDPAAAVALERPRDVELPDGEPEQVDAERDAGAADALARAAEERRAFRPIPRHAAVREQRDFHRNGSIHPLRRAERTQQRKPELEIAD